MCFGCFFLVFEWFGMFLVVVSWFVDGLLMVLKFFSLVLVVFNGIFSRFTLFLAISKKGRPWRAFSFGEVC